MTRKTMFWFARHRRGASRSPPRCRRPASRRPSRRARPPRRGGEGRSARRHAQGPGHGRRQRHVRLRPGDDRHGLQLRRAGLPGVRDAAYLGGILKENGFTVENGVAGIPSAWVAKWGSGRPVIALGSDVDCIPQASQKPGVAYRDQIVDGAPGHGEGHNSGTPLNIVAAIAVKRIMEREKLPGTIMIWPGIAEEQLGTKAYYVREGLFKDVDLVHVQPRRLQPRDRLGRERRQRADLGRVHLRGRDRAQRRRAVARPQRPRRRGADERRLELPPRAPAPAAAVALRRSPTAATSPTSCRATPASGTTSARPATRRSRTCGTIGDKMAEGAALMTNTKWTSRVLGSAWPSHMNRTHGRDALRQHQAGRPADVDRGRPDPGAGPRRRS